MRCSSRRSAVIRAAVLGLLVAPLLGLVGASAIGQAPQPPQEPPDWQAAFRAAQQQRDAATKAASDNEVALALAQQKATALAEWWKKYVEGLTPPDASKK